MAFPKTHSPPTPSFSYKRYRPEKTLLYKLIREKMDGVAGLPQAIISKKFFHIIVEFGSK